MRSWYLHILFQTDLFQAQSHAHLYPGMGWYVDGRPTSWYRPMPWLYLISGGQDSKDTRLYRLMLCHVPVTVYSIYLWWSGFHWQMFDIGHDDLQYWTLISKFVNFDTEKLRYRSSFQSMISKLKPSISRLYSISKLYSVSKFPISNFTWELRVGTVTITRTSISKAKFELRYATQAGIDHDDRGDRTDKDPDASGIQLQVLTPAGTLATWTVTLKSLMKILR